MIVSRLPFNRAASWLFGAGLLGATKGLVRILIKWSPGCEFKLLELLASVSSSLGMATGALVKDVGEVSMLLCLEKNL